MVFDNKWILLVDDEEDIRASVRELLKICFGEKKLKIIEASNGMEATGKIKNQKFDCIITDLKMPKKEGDALLTSVRQNPFNENTPVLILTGFPDERLLTTHRFTYMLEKPFLHDELTDLIGNQLKIGNKGDRLAADMVNCLVQSTKAFLERAMQIENVQIETPKAKKSGESIEVEFASQVNLVDDKVHNSFSLIAKKEDLENLANKMTSLQNKDPQRIALALGQSILKHALGNVHQRTGSSFNIKNLDSKSSRASLGPKKGILIPIVADNVRIEILACGEKKVG